MLEGRQEGDRPGRFSEEIFPGVPVDGRAFSVIDPLTDERVFFSRLLLFCFLGFIPTHSSFVPRKVQFGEDPFSSPSLGP